MNISPAEAEEALAAIQTVTQKTRRMLSASGAYGFLIVWGVIWLVGFLSSQFLAEQTAGYFWMGLDILGGILSAVIGIRMGRYVHNPTATSSGQRIGWFWVLLFILCIAAILVSWPVDGKQLAMLIILFVMAGWIAMSLLIPFASVWVALAITALALLGYFLLPNIFYLWMAVLGGGGMISLGLYIRSRW